MSHCTYLQSAWPVTGEFQIFLKKSMTYLIIQWFCFLYTGSDKYVRLIRLVSNFKTIKQYFQNLVLKSLCELSLVCVRPSAPTIKSSSERVPADPTPRPLLAAPLWETTCPYWTDIRDIFETYIGRKYVANSIFNHKFGDAILRVLLCVCPPLIPWVMYKLSSLIIDDGWSQVVSGKWWAVSKKW